MKLLNYKKTMGILLFILMSFFLFSATTAKVKTVSTSEFYEKGDTIIYNIRIDNPTSKPIENFKVENLILNSEKFSSVTITEDTSSIGSDFGTFNKMGNFSATGIKIPVDGFVQYKIIATLKPSVVTDINITTTLYDEKNKVIDSSSKVIKPVIYNYTVTKTASSSLYNYNGNIVYTITVQNNHSTMPLSNITVTDYLSKINATSLSGISPAFDMSSATISATSTNGSDTGTFSTSGDLEASKVNIKPNSSVKYIITAKVNDNILGDISNKASVLDKANSIKDSDVLTLSQSTPVTTITKTVVSEDFYEPGGVVQYLISVKNTGLGIASNRTVEDLLDEIKVNLSSNEFSDKSSSDILGNPFSNISISTTLGSGSTKSTSDYLKSKDITTSKLKDNNVTIYPGETINYTVTAKTKKYAISDIPNSARLIDKNNGKSIESDVVTVRASGVLYENSEAITRIKTTGVSEYTSGGTVEYSIIVTNTDSSAFANNIKIIDYISKIKAETYLKSTAPAFKNWVLTVEDSSGEGTKPGDFPYGISTTDDINLTADIAPNGTIKYKLTATVNNNISGIIVDSSSTGQDNIKENGAGIKMSLPKLNIEKNVNTAEYISGEELIYVVHVSNDGNGIASEVPIEDILSSIKTEHVDGTTKSAYKSWEISAIVKDSSGVVINNPTITKTGISGTITSDLNTKLTLAPSECIEYIIKAKVDPLAKGKIINKAKVNNNLISDKGVVSKVSKINITKMSNMSLYPILGKKEITYTITLSNDSNNGIALNVPIKDTLSSVQAELLEPLGTKVKAFSSWKISATTSGTGTTSGIFNDNKDLDTSVDIAPGGKVEYKIVATLNSDDTNILYGSFSNTATSGSLSADATTAPQLPDLSISKITKESLYSPNNGVITYEILVKNNGEGYANDAEIKDSLSSVVSENGKNLLSWTIASNTSGVGTTSGSFSDNKDIDTKVDIAPGGYVKYIVTGTIKEGTNGKIINTAEVFDNQSKNRYTASASISENVGNSLFIRKSSESLEYTPGETFVYYIDIKNNSSNDANNIRVKDDILGIKGALANDGGSSPQDLADQAIFKSWEISKDGVSLEANKNLDDEILSLPSGATTRYKIVALVKENAVESKILNEAKLYDINNKLIGSSLIQNNIKNINGYIARSVDKSNYNPGVDTITYTITVGAGDKGYYNDVNLEELIKEIKVDLVDGTSGNPFYDPETSSLNFTVRQDASSIINKGTTTISVSDNNNIAGTVDIKPGDKLVYKVTGKVRKDASGVINFESLSTYPYKPNITLTKRVNEKYYFPGEKITYVLTVDNKSKGNAHGYHILDELKGVTVLTSEGKEEPAFTSFKFKEKKLLEKENGYKANSGTYKDNENLDTLIDIPANGGEIIYEIEALVNEKAIGNITNLLKVENDIVSSKIGAGLEKPFLKKKITKLYDTNGGDFQPGTANYIPGGYIEYDIVLKNLGKGILTDYELKDDIEKIKTDYYDGTTGPAFDSWVITLKEKDTLPSTNPGKIEDNKSIDTKVWIGPKGYITYTVKAKINEKAVGDITNEVVFGGLIDSVKVSSFSPYVTHTKIVKNENGSSSTNFRPGQTVVYEITLENRGGGIAYNTKLSDILSKISAEVSENGSNGIAPKENPFSSWDIEVEKTSENTTTLDGNYSGGNGLSGASGDINLSKISIAPRGNIIFTIKAHVKDTVLGEFTNKSTCTDKDNRVDIQTAKLEPKVASITKSKVISKLNGINFTDGMTYKPGDTLQYLITINNNGEGFANDLDIIDNLDLVTSKLSDGTTGPSLENINIATEKSDGRTYLRAIPASGSRDINTFSDIAPGGNITFKIDGKIKTSSLGTIAENTASVGGSNVSSSVINPKPPVITATKELISPATKKYKPNDEIKYKLTIKNTGEGYGVNIPIKDEISKIQTDLIGGGKGAAFTSWTTKRSVEDVNGITVIPSKSSSTVEIDSDINVINANIAHGATIVYDITAKVNPKAIGEIINIAYVDNTATPSPEITLENAVITMVKTSKNPNYIQGEEVVFYVDIANMTDTTASNVLFEDLVKDIVVNLSTNTEGKALQNDFTYNVDVTGDSNNSFIENPSNNSNISNLKLDIAPKTTVRFTISGKAVINAIGDIENSAKVTYNGKEINKTATVVPILATPSNIKVSKVSSVSNYVPGTPIQYTLKIKNEGTGYATDVKITDNIKNVLTNSIKGGTTLAFDTFRIISSSAESPNTVIKSNNSSVGYDSTANIAPGDTVTVTIEGMVSCLASGTIENIVTANYMGTDIEDKIALNPVPSLLEIKKSVDKLVYISEDTLTYQIEIVNIGQGPALNVVVEDKISEIKATFIDGKIGSVFNPSTISIKRKIGSLSETTLAGTDINDVVNIPTNLKPGENKVIYTVTAKLKPFVNDEIKNIAIVNNVLSNEVISEPKIANINLKKEVSSPIYEPNGKINYILTVENSENTPATGVVITDKIKDILAKSSKNIDAPAFKSWKIISIEDNSDGSSNFVSANPAIGSESSNENIEINGNLGANTTLKIEIEAIVNEDITEVIENSATITYNGVSNQDKVSSTSKNANIVLEKKILSIDNTPYSEALTYTPNGVVVYEIKVSNIGQGFAKDIVINDNITNMVVETSGGKIEQAYNSWAYTTSSSNPLNTIKPVPTNNTNLNSKVTLAPNSDIVFKVEGIVNPIALGIINKNIVTILQTNDENGVPKGLTAESEEVKPGIATLNMNKEIVNGLEYISGEEIEYKITVENTSKVFAKDINIEDIISNIKAQAVGGDQIDVFDSWTVDVQYTNPNTATEGKIGTSIDLYNKVDLPPNNKIVYMVKGKVKPNIVGDITNIAKITYNGITKDLPVTSILKKTQSSDINVTKKVTNINEEYTPGSNIIFEILIENKSNNIMNNIRIKDEISKILSESVDGILKPAFVDWKISSAVTGDALNSNIKSIPKSGDIDSIIDLGKQSSVLITISGTTSSTVVGEVVNTAYWSYDNIIDKEITAKAIPSLGEVLITKTVNSPTYNIGDTMLYKLEITNTGTGFAKGISLEDDIKGILTDISNSNIQDKAFKKWTIKKEVIPSNSSIENRDLSNGYSADLNIYPGETIKIEIEAELNDNVLGEISNIGKITYNSNSKDSKIDIKAESISSSDIIITKTVDKTECSPKDILTYTIKVKNKSKNWANNINLQDNLNEIETRVIGGANARGKAFLFEAANDLNETFNLAPNEEVEYKLKAKVVSNLTGKIDNIAKITFNNNSIESNKVSTYPIMPTIYFMKEVVEKEYIPGQSITYKITLKNDSTNNISGINLTDYVRDITAKNYMNKDVPAFSSWKTTFKSNNPSTTIYSLPNANENIDTIIDIGAKDELVFTIVGVTNIDTTGIISNTATATIPEPNGGSITVLRTKDIEAKPYKLNIYMEQKDTIYNPGDWVEYIINVENLSESPALNIELAHIVKDAMSDYLGGNKDKIFTEWNFDIITKTGLLENLRLAPNEDISQKLFLDGKSSLKIRVKAKVASEMIGDIKLNSKLTDSTIAKSTLSSNYVEFKPSKPSVLVTKTSQVITNSLGIEDTIIYTITLENEGIGNGTDVIFKDELSKIIAENGDKAFDSWKVTYKEKGKRLNSNLSIRENNDINNIVLLENNRKNTIIYTITATLNKTAFGSISNTATIKDAFGNTSSSTVEDQIKDSSGQLVVYKKAFKDSVKPGDAVEYEVIVKNQTEVTYENVILVDRIPAGFKYLKKTAYVTFFDKNGKAYKNFSTSPVLIGKNLNFEPLTIKGKESFSVRYLLKPSVGVTVGKYENKAYATKNGDIISNTAKATVEVTADPLFDTASIIGKVFHDLNGDNYQNNPEAENLLVKINMNKDEFIPKSATIILNKVEKKLEDKDIISAKGVYIKKIKGIDSRIKNQDNKVVIKYRSKSNDFTSLKLTSSEGTSIIINANGEYISTPSSDVKSGMNSQIISLKQNIYSDDNDFGVYTHEFIIENNAFYENGIPGVRVFNADGILVETDAYGRYHIPDQWILNKKGQNIVIKVDEGSLPKGMRVTSENPYVKRVSSKVLNQFNFSVQENMEKESD